MNVDNFQIKILLSLAEYNKLGYNELYNKTGRPRARGTFQKRLYGLVNDWDPPLVTYEAQEKRDMPFLAHLP